MFLTSYTYPLTYRLYIPPYWFHHVTAVGDAMSISMRYNRPVFISVVIRQHCFKPYYICSFHTESDWVQLRDTLNSYGMPATTGWNQGMITKGLHMYVSALLART